MYGHHKSIYMLCAMCVIQNHLTKQIQDFHQQEDDLQCFFSIIFSQDLDFASKSTFSESKVLNTIITMGTKIKNMCIIQNKELLIKLITV